METGLICHDTQSNKAEKREFLLLSSELMQINDRDFDLGAFFQTINTVSEVIRGSQVNQDYFASVNAPSNPPR